MLAGNFYTIITQDKPDDTVVQTTISLNAAHPIFEGHFPGQPVVPGVCMMQIIQELLSGAVGRKLLVQKAANIKFLNMIDPVQQPQVHVTITYIPQEDGYKTNASIQYEAITFLKFQGFFK